MPWNPDLGDEFSRFAEDVRAEVETGESPAGGGALDDDDDEV